MHFASRGFTLFELVIVLFIVGVVFTSAILVMPLGGKGASDRELDILAERIDRTRDQAIFTARPYGLALWRRGYDFFAWHPEEGWLAPGGIDGPSSTEFEAIEVVGLATAGVTIPVADEPPDGPQVVFPPSGEVTTLETRLFAVSGNEFRFSINALGETGFALW